MNLAAVGGKSTGNPDDTQGFLLITDSIGNELIFREFGGVILSTSTRFTPPTTAVIFWVATPSHTARWVNGINTSLKPTVWAIRSGWK